MNDVKIKTKKAPAPPKAPSFRCPGVHHDITVRLVTKRQILKALPDDDKDVDCIAFYDEAVAEIYIQKDLLEPRMIQTFCHEIGHHVDYELTPCTDEEQRCDLFGLFLARFADSWETTKKNLLPEKKKRTTKKIEVPE